MSKPPEIRREELLDASAALFSERGITDTGIGDITERVNVARGTFYLYFASKDEVIAELWKRYVDGYMTLTDLALGPAGTRAAAGEVIVDLIEKLTRHALAHGHLHKVIYETADAAALALCRKSDEMILTRLTEAIRAYFRRTGHGQERAELTASLLFFALDGALHRSIMRQDVIDEVSFVEEIKVFTANALGLRSRSSD